MTVALQTSKPDREKVGLEHARDVAERRTRSRCRQGHDGHPRIPTTREDWLRRPMDAFDRIVRERAFHSHFFEVN